MFVYLQNVKKGSIEMDFTVKEYSKYNEEEILNLYRSVGWINYVNQPEMLKNAYIVLPEYQRQGIGTALLKRVLDTYEYVYQKTLLTDNTERTIQFYKSLGFQMDTEIECRSFMTMR